MLKVPQAVYFGAQNMRNLLFGRGPRLALGFTLAGLIWACTEPQSAPPPKEKPMPKSELRLPWNRLPLLPPGTVPDSYQQARQFFKTATTAYDQAYYRKAARLFESTARTLQTSTSAPFASTLRTARCVSYENAIGSYRAARQNAQLPQKVQVWIDQDEGCRHSLKRRLRRIAHEDSGTTITSSKSKP